MNSPRSGRSVVFELWRQDDNGNRFLIGVFPGRAAAEEHMAELCRNPHKQIYWIAEKRDGAHSPPSSG